ncbi:MAG: hypothetical protein AAGG38_10540 [Planctomycetota bacterium]
MVTQPPDDEPDVYQLSDDDAFPEPEPPPADEPGPANSAAASGTAPPDSEYELDTPVALPARDDLKILILPPRYCLACGHDLTLVEDDRCPYCEKVFDPENPSTYADEPIKSPGNWWLEPPRVAGYALLATYLLGRIVIGLSADAIGGRFGEVTIAFGVLATLPWVVLCVLLALAAIGEHHNPKITVAVPLGFAFGLLFTLGLHPAIVFAGTLTGAFAGLVRAWRAT